MPEGSPARGVAAGLLLVALAAGVIWTLWPSDNAGTVAAPPASASVEAQPSAPAVEPSAQPVQPEQPEQPEQPAGPATGDYAELATAAELEHPDTDPHIRRWYDWFESIRGPWGNRAEVWDATTAGIRDEAALLGPPYTHPLFDGDTAQPALATVIWAVTHPEGDGDVAVVKTTYRDDGRVTTRVWGVLIGTDGERNGRVLARMEPFDLFVTDFESFPELQKAADSRVWEWVVAQGATEDEIGTVREE